jgi:hypothetical protein
MPSNVSNPEMNHIRLESDFMPNLEKKQDESVSTGNTRYRMNFLIGAICS